MIFWKLAKNSIRWYVQLKRFETAQFWTFYPPLLAHGFFKNEPKIGLWFTIKIFTNTILKELFLLNTVVWTENVP